VGKEVGKRDKNEKKQEEKRNGKFSNFVINKQNFIQILIKF